ncbi:MAG: hypothetical protein IKS71_06540 [Bacteroidales bacterium]|nr:hypothetical protein [Bacteroidales bacterium]
MKKFIGLIAALCLITGPVFSLGAQSYGDDNYLPEQGEWAISVSAVPIFTYLGQFFNGAGANGLNDFASQPYLNGDAATAGFAALTPMASVTVRHMLSNELGLRINAGWLYNDRVSNFYSRDDAAYATDPLSSAKVTDTRTNRSNGVSIMAGLERHVGTRRIQGIFGGGVLIAGQSSSVKYTYGNAITEYNQTPTCSNGGLTTPAGAGLPALAASHASLRYLDTHSATRDRYLGAVAYAGVEWFFTPKISIGGEVNIAAVYSWTGVKHFTVEGYNAYSGEVDTWSELTAPGSSRFVFGTGNVGANLNLSFYF